MHDEDLQLLSLLFVFICVFQILAVCRREEVSELPRKTYDIGRVQRQKKNKIGAFKTLKCATRTRSGIFISVPQAVEPVSLIGAKLCVLVRGTCVNKLPTDRYMTVK